MASEFQSTSAALTVLIPMAGAGKRFSDAGYDVPKPFIDVHGTPMIELVLDSFLSTNPLRFILVVQVAHYRSYESILMRLKRRFDVRVVCVNGLTLGQTCTSLAGHREIASHNPLLIANCDEIIQIPVHEFVSYATEKKLDGLIATFPSDEPRWSFAKTGEDGLVLETAEKRQISSNATLGWYYFSRGQTFLDAAIDQIVANDSYNGEFYVCPTYNYVIKRGGRIGIFSVEKQAKIGLGTPDELNEYLNKRVMLK